MRKKQVIRTESYVTKNGQLVRFDDLSLEEKRIAATRSPNCCSFTRSV